MKTMKILIVDDEPLARSRLCDLLEEIEEVEVAGEAGNGQQAIDQTRSLAPDLVLLDIRMPGMSGLEVAEALRQLPRPPVVIFTTAYGDHALEAFEADAIDYLLKPIRRSRLEQALQKARPLVEQAAAASPGEGEGRQRSHICAHHRGNLILVPVEEIYYFQADHKYIVVRHKGGEVLIDESLKSLEEEFGDRFTRIHRNALVSNAHIQTLEKSADGHHYIRLRGVEEGLAVSRRQLSVVRKLVASLGSSPRL